MLIGYERTSEKKTQRKFCFLMRSCSTLIEFITLKMIEYRRLIVQLPILEMVSGKKRKLPQKVMIRFGVCSKGVSPLVIFEDGTMTTIDTSKRCFQLLSSLVMTCLESIGLSSKTVQRHTFMQNHKNGALDTFLVLSTRTVGPQTILI